MNPTPEQIRRDTAKATRAAAQDAKAVVQGVGDAMKKNGAVDVNTASADDLEKLPGVDPARARRIIANRPYDHTDDMVKKHAISQDEYDRISSQVVAK
jgi:DNA uptake protein ComE-like DNA-binding protein